MLNILLVLIKLDVLDTKQNKGILYTELELEEVAVKGQSERVSFTVNQKLKVLPNSNFKEVYVQLLKNVLVVALVTFVY